MPLPDNAKQWKEKAEIDYIGPFVKAWAAFNAWFREAAGDNVTTDKERLEYLTQHVNTVRSAILPLLQPVQQGIGGTEDENAVEFRFLVERLNTCLEAHHFNFSKKWQILRISFRECRITNSPELPHEYIYSGQTYKMNKSDRKWRISLLNRNGAIKFETDFDEYKNNLESTISTGTLEDFQHLSPTEKDQLRWLFNSRNPYSGTDLFSSKDDLIKVGSLDFRCSPEDLFAGIVMVIYEMRNALLHGETETHPAILSAYDPAYHIIMKFLNAIR